MIARIYETEDWWHAELWRPLSSSEKARPVRTAAPQLDRRPAPVEGHVRVAVELRCFRWTAKRAARKLRRDYEAGKIGQTPIAEIIE